MLSRPLERSDLPICSQTSYLQSQLSPVLVCDLVNPASYPMLIFSAVMGRFRLGGVLLHDRVRSQS